MADKLSKQSIKLHFIRPEPVSTNLKKIEQANQDTCGFRELRDTSTYFANAKH